MEKFLKKFEVSAIGESLCAEPGTEVGCSTGLSDGSVERNWRSFQGYLRRLHQGGGWSWLQDGSRWSQM